MKPFRLVITCEHGGNGVPRRWARLFRDSDLRSHRGYDIGAAPVARALAAAFRAPVFIATTSRLLVDLNRSATHPRLFSEKVRALPPEERSRILAEYYAPHREAVEAAIARAVRTGPVLHLGVHSFTPVLDGKVRRADVGLLYDPRRRSERAFCDPWHAAFTGLVVRRNYPYRGVSDGFTTALRRKYADASYIGVELELNQGRFATKRDAARMTRIVVESLRAALESATARPATSRASSGSP
jgi:predicted N-formylglutamate amidohydrolase